MTRRGPGFVRGPHYCIFDIIRGSKVRRACRWATPPCRHLHHLPGSWQTAATPHVRRTAGLGRALLSEVSLLSMVFARGTKLVASEHAAASCPHSRSWPFGFPGEVTAAGGPLAPRQVGAAGEGGPDAYVGSRDLEVGPEHHPFRSRRWHDHRPDLRFDSPPGDAARDVEPEGAGCRRGGGRPARGGIVLSGGFGWAAGASWATCWLSGTTVC